MLADSNSNDRACCPADADQTPEATIHYTMSVALQSSPDVFSLWIRKIIINNNLKTALGHLSLNTGKAGGATYLLICLLLLLLPFCPLLGERCLPHISATISS